MGLNASEFWLRRGVRDFGEYLSGCVMLLTMYAEFRDDGAGRYGLSQIERDKYDCAFVAAVLDAWDEHLGLPTLTTRRWPAE
jgi:hypothetical protein